MSDIRPDSPEWPNEEVQATVWTYLGLASGGALLGLVGAFLQAVEISVGPVTLPLWMLVVLIGMLAVARALTLHYESRKPAVFWFLGWIAVTLLLSLPLPGGDQVISDGATAMIYVFGGAVLGSTFVSLPPLVRPSQGEGSKGEESKGEDPAPSSVDRSEATPGTGDERG